MKTGATYPYRSSSQIRDERKLRQNQITEIHPKKNVKMEKYCQLTNSVTLQLINNKSTVYHSHKLCELKNVHACNFTTHKFTDFNS